jgi:hypothetical protein
MADDPKAHDARARHCPMLGHEVRFSYCRSPASDLPCRRVADCWFERFDVVAWLRAQFTDEQMAHILAPPADKACTLVELIERARKAAEEKR